MAKRVETQERARRGGIVAALRDLTDGMGVLFRQHLELVRLEVKEDARIFSSHVAILIFFSMIALLGYAMLNMAAVLFAGWGFGIHGMAITTLLLAAVNLGFGLRAMRGTWQRLKADGMVLDRTAQELERDVEWVKEIRDR